MREKVHSAMHEMVNPHNSRLEKTLKLQGRVIEGRGNALLNKANEVRAQNAELRQEISKPARAPPARGAQGGSRGALGGV